MGLMSGAWAAPMVLAITNASVKVDVFSGLPTLQIELTPKAQRSFAKFTTRHLGQAVDFIIDDTIVSSPVVQAPILGPSLIISGDFTFSELTVLARRLSDGNAMVAVEAAAE